MAHRFTCGEKKIWKNMEKSQSIMKLIVGLIEKTTPNYNVFIDEIILLIQKWESFLETL